MIDRYQLADGASCSIAVGWGCNVISWSVKGEELMFCPPELPQQATKASGGGSPLLFPAIGRTWDLNVEPAVFGEYKIYGSDKTYYMPSHGILFLSAFSRIALEEQPDRISATYQLEVPDEVREQNYPFDVAYTQRFTLTADGIEFETTITNRGEKAAPVAFGHHPYFRISNPRRDGVEVHLPVTEWLKTNPATVLFNGESESADQVLKLKPEVYYDHVFAGTVGNRMSLIDQIAGRRVHVDFDDNFEHLTVFSPDGSDFVCIEPWTRGLGAFCYLDEPGWENSYSVPVLRGGQTKTLKVRFGVEQ